MKTNVLLFSLFSVVLLNGCSTYYYSALDGKSDFVKKGEQGDLIIDNDTVCITYSFDGENAPVKISIYNKSEKALYVDWHKSALIVNDIATTYKNEQIQIDGNTSSSTSQYWGYANTNGDFSGQITVPKDVSFIPPKSKIIHSSLKLNGFPFDNISETSYVDSYLFRRDGMDRKVKAIEFTKENSPLTFKSYLTLYSDVGPTQSNPIIFEHEFYVSKFTKAGGFSPSDMYVNNQNKNVFYVRDVKGEGAALAGIIVAAVAIDAAAYTLEAKTNNNRTGR